MKTKPIRTTLQAALTGFILSIALTANGSTFETDLVAAAYERTQSSVSYDGRYFSISYPGGDVPSHIGVCTDVIIRSYRKIGTDLQKLVHEDMTMNFDRYPSNRIWGLTTPDKNIDHRRVPNLQVFFSRRGEQLRISFREALKNTRCLWLTGESRVEARVRRLTGGKSRTCNDKAGFACKPRRARPVAHHGFVAPLAKDTQPWPSRRASPRHATGHAEALGIF